MPKWRAFSTFILLSPRDINKNRERAWGKAFFPATCHNTHFTLLCGYANSCTAERNSLAARTRQREQPAASNSASRNLLERRLKLNAYVLGAESAHTFMRPYQKHTRRTNTWINRKIKYRHTIVCVVTRVSSSGTQWDQYCVWQQCKLPCSLFIWSEIKLTFAACSFVCSKFLKDGIRKRLGEIKNLLGIGKVLLVLCTHTLQSVALSWQLALHSRKVILDSLKWLGCTTSS